MSKRKPTIEYMDIRVDFSDDNEFLQKPVVVYTRTFNHLLGLREYEWACFIVPDTETTNGASWNPLVTFLLWLEKRDPKIRLGALGHDYLYIMAGLPIQFYKFDKENRKVAGKLDALVLERGIVDDFIQDKGKALGCSGYQAGSIKLGLKIGGGPAWRRYVKFNTK